MCVFDVLLMKQSMSHKSVGAPTLIINVSILKADNNWKKATYVWSHSLWTPISPFLQTRPQLPESRAEKSHMMFTFAYQKKCPPTPFFFLYVWTVFGWVPGSQPLLVLVVPHFLIRVRPPASSHHAHEGKQSWHVSLMRSRARSVGKELRFHTH